ncbi:unnamed protein product [Somion occarium]|uniref:C2H2-type domain-containing protein n=1 Tax=Somion occarium TaxID=3059160 RepID=A0ABP1E5R4_9APHY
MAICLKAPIQLPYLLPLYPLVSTTGSYSRVSDAPLLSQIGFLVFTVAMYSPIAASSVPNGPGSVLRPVQPVPYTSLRLPQPEDFLPESRDATLQRHRLRMQGVEQYLKRHPDNPLREVVTPTPPLFDTFLHISAMRSLQSFTQEAFGVVRTPTSAPPSPLSRSPSVPSSTPTMTSTSSVSISPAPQTPPPKKIKLSSDIRPKMNQRPIVQQLIPDEHGCHIGTCGFKFSVRTSRCLSRHIRQEHFRGVHGRKHVVCGWVNEATGMTCAENLTLANMFAHVTRCHVPLTWKFSCPLCDHQSEYSETYFAEHIRNKHMEQC